MTAKRNDVTKVTQTSMGLSFASANPAEFPIAYQEELWDRAEADSELAKLMGNGSAGQYDQHAINEALAGAAGGAADTGDIETAIAYIQTDISDMGGSISDLQSDIEQAQSDISDLQNNFSTAQSGISNLQTDLSTAQSDISDLQSDVSTAQSDISSLQSDVSALQNNAFSGSYNDLTDKPTIPAAQIQADWNQTDSSALDFIKNKPNISDTDMNQVALDLMALNGLMVLPKSYYEEERHCRFEVISSEEHTIRLIWGCGDDGNYPFSNGNFVFFPKYVYVPATDIQYTVTEIVAEMSSVYSWLPNSEIVGQLPATIVLPRTVTRFTTGATSPYEFAHYYIPDSVEEIENYSYMGHFMFEGDSIEFNSNTVTADDDEIDTKFHFNQSMLPFLFDTLQTMPASAPVASGINKYTTLFFKVFQHIA